MCDLVCKKCNLPFVNIRVLGVHIKRTHKMETKEYYDTYYEQTKEYIKTRIDENIKNITNKIVQ